MIDSIFFSGLNLIAPVERKTDNKSTLVKAWTANNKKFIPNLFEDKTALFKSVIVKEDKQYDDNAKISSYFNFLTMSFIK